MYSLLSKTWSYILVGFKYYTVVCVCKWLLFVFVSLFLDMSMSTKFKNI